MNRKPVIERIGRNIDRLIERDRILTAQTDSLTAECDKLRLENRRLKENVAALERRIGVLELKASLTGNGADVRKARARINRLMREIDRCIALMNG